MQIFLNLELHVNAYSFHCVLIVKTLFDVVKFYPLNVIFCTCCLVSHSNFAI